MKSGAGPLVKYHVLRVKAGVKQITEDSSNNTGEHVAIHLVRGHFKTYTKDKPLLGRAVGTFWWQPHVAGKAPRIVYKDYEVERVNV